MLILKTPGGNPVGYARMTRENEKNVIFIPGVCGPEARVIAMNAEHCEALVLDRRGHGDCSFEPDALAVLDAQGDAIAVAAPRGAQEAAISRARRLVIAEDASQRALMQAEFSQEEASAPPQEKQDDVDEKPPMAREWPNACSAWPPPPFFPDAQFKDGAWRM